MVVSFESLPVEFSAELLRQHRDLPETLPHPFIYELSHNEFSLWYVNEILHHPTFGVDSLVWDTIAMYLLRKCVHYTLPATEETKKFIQQMIFDLAKQLRSAQ